MMGHGHRDGDNAASRGGAGTEVTFAANLPDGDNLREVSAWERLGMWPGGPCPGPPHGEDVASTESGRWLRAGSGAAQ